MLAQHRAQTSVYQWMANTISSMRKREHGLNKIKMRWEQIETVASWSASLRARKWHNTSINLLKKNLQEDKKTAKSQLLRWWNGTSAAEDTEQALVSCKEELTAAKQLYAEGWQLAGVAQFPFSPLCLLIHSFLLLFSACSFTAELVFVTYHWAESLRTSLRRQKTCLQPPPTTHWVHTHTQDGF